MTAPEVSVTLTDALPVTITPPVKTKSTLFLVVAIYNSGILGLDPGLAHTQAHEEVDIELTVREESLMRLKKLIA